MALNVDDSFIDNLMDWAASSQDASPGDPISLPDDIADYIDTQWQNIGDYVTDSANIPAGAEERGGTFSNPYDMMQHWLGSGLLGVDGNGDIVPSPLLTIFVEAGPDGEPVYTVWVGYED